MTFNPLALQDQLSGAAQNRVLREQLQYIQTLFGIPAATRTEAGTDATPSVRNIGLLQVNHADTATITALDDGVQGQTVLVKFGSANTTVDFSGTTLKGNAGSDWTPASGDAMRCTFDGTNWYCAVIDATA